MDLRETERKQRRTGLLVFFHRLHVTSYILQMNQSNTTLLFTLTTLVLFYVYVTLVSTFLQILEYSSAT
jgi:hypothetical protein